MALVTSLNNLIVLSQVGAEICLATYEASASVLRALVSSQALDFVRENGKLVILAEEGRPWMDSWVHYFLQNINSLPTVGVLARARRAILLNWKVMKPCFLTYYFYFLFLMFELFWHSCCLRFQMQVEIA